MSEINQFALYSQCSGVSYCEDEVSLFIKKMETLKDLDDITRYINSKFGEYDTEKTVDYPNLNKKIKIKNIENGLAVSVLSEDELIWCSSIAKFENRNNVV